jgi:diguanylate cyclase (GGDEF)-like protein
VFAQTAQENLTSPELIGRIGGEEFAVVFYDVGQERAMARAELIRTSFAERANEVDGYPVAARLSIGMAFCNNAPLDVPELLMQADQALYDARSARIHSPIVLSPHSSPEARRNEFPSPPKSVT